MPLFGTISVLSVTGTKDQILAASASVSLSSLSSLSLRTNQCELVPKDKGSRSASTSPVYDPKEDAKFVDDWNKKKLGLSGEVLKGKNARQYADAHAFYRANPALFNKQVNEKYSDDLNFVPGKKAVSGTILGDAHLGNFGSFRGRDGKAVFGANDYDQARKGRLNEDIARAAVSANEVCRQHGCSEDDRRKLVKDFTSSYLDEMKDIAKGKTKLTDGAFVRDDAKDVVKDLLKKSDSVKREDMLGEIATKGKNGYALKDDYAKELDAPHEKAVRATFDAYNKKHGGDMKLLDTGVKNNAGGSSYGLDRYTLLVQEGDKTPRLLEMKRAPSVDASSTWDASKASAAQKALGLRANDRDDVVNIGSDAYLVREREQEKGDIDLAKIKTKDLDDYAKMTARAMARAHASQGSDVAKEMVQYSDGNEDVLNNRVYDFSERYANQLEADYTASKAMAGL
jgi:uncharacterized protein (DUF2252 family)